MNIINLKVYKKSAYNDIAYSECVNIMSSDYDKLISNSNNKELLEGQVSIYGLNGEYQQDIMDITKTTLTSKEDAIQARLNCEHENTSGMPFDDILYMYIVEQVDYDSDIDDMLF